MRGTQIGLALQGGGSYAAFTSGVLDALLNKRRNFVDAERIHSITGTSGGAINATLLGYGIRQHPNDPAKAVRELWKLNRMEAIIRDQVAGLNVLPDSALSKLIAMNRQLAATHPEWASFLREHPKLKAGAMDVVNNLVHQAAPELPEDLTQALFDQQAPFVTVAATEVKSANAHYFTNNQAMIERFQAFEIAQHKPLLQRLSLQGVYASIAHPKVFNPVVIDDNIYWDGYYTSNPPFIYTFREGCDEVILIRLIQQQRNDLSPDFINVEDRTEEIIQNTTLNMEILTYLSWRELINSNQGEEYALKLADQPISRNMVFHEIRLLKPGNIADEGYPMGKFVEKLIHLGSKVVTDRQGFIKTYKSAETNRHVISEIDFDSETVSSRAIDMDRLLFDEDWPLPHHPSFTQRLGNSIKTWLKP